MAHLPGDRLLAGRYRLLERLGSGGMAAVYLAADERLGRRVALKRLRSDGSEEARSRFRREARLLAALNHPNIVAVFDTVGDDEGLLIVMEHVDGETLAAALARGPLRAERAAEIVTAVAAALDHAHGRGIVHRDVKPANVLLGRDGQIKLADLGIARMTEGTQLTRTGTVLGTAAYMAPEQLEGRAPTPLADVYSLAAVAWEALAGRKAQPGRTPVEIAHRIATAPPPDLRAAWPQAPAAAAELLGRAMARDPAARPPSAGAFARELAAALAEGPVAATVPLSADAPPAAPSVPRWRRGRWTLGIAALLAVAAVAVGAVLAAGGGEEGPAERTPAAAAPSDAGERPAARDEAERRPAPAPAPAEREEPVETQPADPVAKGLALQQEGYAHLQAERLDEAIDASRRAAELLAGSERIEYWYALYNLGRALRLAGRPGEAIPVLERRLEHPDQRDVVRRELEAARTEAGRRDDRRRGGPRGRGHWQEGDRRGERRGRRGRGDG